MKRKILILLFVLLVLGLQAQIPILVNGGFEQPRLSPMAVQVVTPDGPDGPDLPGWDLWEGRALLHSAPSGWGPLEGDQSLTFPSSAFTVLEQAFPTDPGVTYELSFALAATGPGRPASLSWEVWSIGTLASGEATTPDFQLFTACFTAETTLTFLTFTHGGPVGLRSAELAGITTLDSVRVVVVPEPGGWACLALLAGLGFVVASRKR